MNQRNLVIYNLETDLDSHVLASAHDWISEFAHHYSKVIVYTTHLGRTELPKNVYVFETGGGNIKRRSLAIFKLFGSVIKLFKIRKSTDVFHHMSSRTLLLLGLPLKLMKIPQIIWYSHSVADLSFKFGAKFAEMVVSATSESAPQVSGVRTKALGHGISISRLGEVPNNCKRKNGVASVGRVVSIKNIEKAIHAISNSNSKMKECKQTLTLIGPYDKDSTYCHFLMKEAEKSGVQLNFLGPVDYRLIPQILCETSIVFTGTPKSADKAALEAAMMGCLILTTNESVQKLTGMDTVIPSMELASNLDRQFAWMASLPQLEIEKIRERLIKISREFNSLEKLVMNVISCFNILHNKKGVTLENQKKV